MGGTVPTAGGLIFSGDNDDNLVAFDAKTGKDLWHFSMRQYVVGLAHHLRNRGKQYVTIATDLFPFALFEH